MEFFLHMFLNHLYGVFLNNQYFHKILAGICQSSYFVDDLLLHMERVSSFIEVNMIAPIFNTESILAVA